MPDTNPSDRAVRLERLLDDYSYPERRDPELLEEIDTLVEEARREGLLATGATPAEVRAAIGPPHRILGEEGEERLDWHYPVLPPAETPPGRGEWSLVLRFRNGALRSAERRLWREQM